MIRFRLSRYHIHLLPRHWIWGRSAVWWDWGWNVFGLGPVVIFWE